MTKKLEKISLETGGLEGGTVALDLIVPEYFTSQREGVFARRILVSKNPNYIMFISTNNFLLDEKSPIELRTPKQYDEEFRKSVREEGDFHDGRIRLEGQLYRKIMVHYTEGFLAESDMERAIAELKRISQEEHDAEEATRKKYNAKLKEAGFDSGLVKKAKKTWSANLTQINNKYGAQKREVDKILGISRKVS